MATTTNYGWTTPDDTALVKDGASAIRSLGSAIDTSMFTTNKAGLIHIQTTSFSAQSSVSISSVFSSTYTNYKIFLNTTNASGGSLRVRLRSSTTDNTTSNYASNYRFRQVGGAGDSSLSDGFTTSWTIAQASDPVDISTDLTLFNPFGTDQTYYVQNSLVQFGASYYYIEGGAVQTESLSFDGITFFTGTNSMTGAISVYGVRK